MPTQPLSHREVLSLRQLLASNDFRLLKLILDARIGTHLEAANGFIVKDPVGFLSTEKICGSAVTELKQASRLKICLEVLNELDVNDGELHKPL